jgi:protein transport protein SEC24
MQPESTDCTMLVMSDVDDVFLPKPNDLLVNLSECRASLESLLGRLNDMFVENHTVGSALGPALQSGFKLIVSFLGLTSSPLFIPSESYWR